MPTLESLWFIKVSILQSILDRVVSNHGLRTRFPERKSNFFHSYKLKLPLAHKKSETY